MAKPPLPTLDFFRGFDAAARHKSFTRAAEELHLTQSALSREIKKLEDEIGTPLFERGRRGLELTTAGETLHVVVRSVLREVAQVVTTIRAQTQRPDEVIHLIGGLASGAPPAAFAAFDQAASDCGVDGLSLYEFPLTSPIEWAHLSETQLGQPALAACAG